MRTWLQLLVLVILVSCQQKACPSPAGGSCDPSNADCPRGYSCAVTEVCTRRCEQTSDCWVKVEDGCRGDCAPGQLLSDGGLCSEERPEDGFCSETKRLGCIAGYCQYLECADGRGDDGLCRYQDIYGPADYDGNR